MSRACPPPEHGGPEGPLAHPVRLKILELAGAEALTAAELLCALKRELSDELGEISLRSVYGHIAVLRDSGYLHLIHDRGISGPTRHAHRTSDRAAELGIALGNLVRANRRPLQLTAFLRPLVSELLRQLLCLVVDELTDHLHSSRKGKQR